MQKNELEKYMDFLLSAAIKKCGNLKDAEDLTQETLLAALSALSEGKDIETPEAWLRKIMNCKFYDRLRRQYKMPMISYDLLSDEMPDSGDDFMAVIETEEAETLRRGIAYLTKLYREVVIRHYMNGEGIEQIAKSLDIPAGTVKSRLDAGRRNIKRGMDEMENYTKQSYQPERLHISNSGNPGLNGEPGSITDNDKIAQNLLILAYEKPVTILDLAKAIGIPTAYIEPIIDRLVTNELMKRTGNGLVYTDFIIYRPEDKYRHIPAQEKFANTCFELFWQPAAESLDKIRKMDFYTAMNLRQQQKLEYYFIVHAFENAIFGAGNMYYNPNRYENFPDRPNGGKWVAMGHAYPENYNRNDAPDRKFDMSGERKTYIERFLQAKKIILLEYDTKLDEPHPHTHLWYPAFSGDIAKLLYIIHTGIDPEDTGFDITLLEYIPDFAESGVFTLENGRAEVDIPVFDMQSYREFADIGKTTINQITEAIKTPLAGHLKSCKQPIPSHLKSVPEQKQYLPGIGCILMAVIYEAINRSLLFHDTDFICPPMLLVIDK